MIQLRTYVKSADNSGAIQVMCIRVLGKTPNSAKIGDIIIGVVKTAVPNRSIKRSDIVRAVIVRTKKTISRKNSVKIKFKNNAVVIIDKDNNPCGTRIFGPIAKELQEKNFKKIVSLASNIF